MRLLLRFLHGLMAALFIFAAALQYNDVDPLRWIAIYLAAATVCILSTVNRPKPIWAAIVAIVALGWAATYAIHGAWRVSVPELFSSWEMKNQTIVAGREMDGLFIVLFWMAVVWVSARMRVAGISRV